MRFGKTVVGITILSAATAAVTPKLFGQGMPMPPTTEPRQHDGPPEGGPGGPDEGGPGMHGIHGHGMHGGPEGMQGGPEGMQGGPGGPGGGPMGRAGRPMGAIMSYLDLVDRYSQLSSNSSASSVSAVVTLTDVLRPKGPQAVVDELNKVLATAKDPAVVRAIRLQLIDWYRAAQQPDKAVEQAEILIGGVAPTTQPSLAQ